MYMTASFPVVELFSVRQLFCKVNFSNLKTKTLFRFTLTITIVFTVKSLNGLMTNKPHTCPIV